MQTLNENRNLQGWFFLINQIKRCKFALQRALEARVRVSKIKEKVQWINL